MNTVQFKMKLVEDLTRKWMDELFGNFVPDDEAKHVYRSRMEEE